MRWENFGPWLEKYQVRLFFGLFFVIVLCGLAAPVK